MKRSKWSTVFLSFTVVAVLAGCSKAANTTQSSTPGTAATAAPATAAAATPAPTAAPLKKISISVHFPAKDRKEDTALEEDKVKRFIAKYPNVTITPDAWQYKPEEIAAKASGGQLPTFFQTYATEGKYLVEKGWVADITSLVNSYEFAKQLNPTLLNQFKLGDKIYGLPQDGYVVGVGINKKLLDAKGVALPPTNWTWDDLLKTAKAAADSGKGIAGIAPMGKGNESGWNFTNFLFAAGGEIEKVDGGKVTVAFNTPEGAKAVEFYKSLNAANALPKNWATLGWGEAMAAFAQGRTAMVIGGVDGPPDQALNQGGQKLSDILVYPVPAVQNGGKHIGVLGGNFFVFNPKADKDQLEMAFRYATFDYFQQDGINSLEKNIQDRKKNNKFFVPKPLDYYDPTSEYGQKVKAMYDKYDNVFQYSADFIKLAEGKAEAQYNGQDYYAEMTKIVQAVFKNKDADTKQLLDDAAKAFQVKLDAVKP